MDKHVLKKIEYGLVIGFIIVGVILWLAPKKTDDIKFCQNFFSILGKGREEAGKFIDWNNFNAFDLINVGERYAKLANEQERQIFRKGFILGFNYVFIQGSGVGDGLKLYTNWRIYRKEKDNVIVSVDLKSEKKRLLFSVSASGNQKERKIIALRLEDR